MSKSTPTFEPLEGLLAINKPRGISSGEAIRQLIRVLTKSQIFKPTLAQEAARRKALSSNQKKRTRKVTWKHGTEVKMGHGGTLDPMASGVLVLGIGGGTKQLQRFLDGTKSYEAVAMFGCETDSYDALGDVLKTAPHAHITRELVEEKLAAFRGDIMQRPPIFSALRHEGKRYYEYAREGLPLPIEIQSRPVRTDILELREFTRNHEYKFPEKEASQERKLEAEALEAATGNPATKVAEATIETEAAEPATSEPVNAPETEEAVGTERAGDKRARTSSPPLEDGTDTKRAKVEESTDSEDATNPPIARIYMSVTKGFYVRSLVNDLGSAVGSAAHMVKLVRTQQGAWELGKNVFEWEELIKQPEETWGPKVESILRQWTKDNAGNK